MIDEEADGFPLARYEVEILAVSPADARVEVKYLQCVDDDGAPRAHLERSYAAMHLGIPLGCIELQHGCAWMGTRDYR